MKEITLTITDELYTQLEAAYDQARPGMLYRGDFPLFLTGLLGMLPEFGNELQRERATRAAALHAHHESEGLLRTEREKVQRLAFRVRELSDQVQRLIDIDPESVSPANEVSPGSPAAIAYRMDRFVQIAGEIRAALRDGTVFVWRQVDAQHGLPLARAMGLTLVTETRLKTMGYRLKKTAKPVGRVYYGAPISDYRSVYVLEAQAVKLATTQTTMEIEE